MPASRRRRQPNEPLERRDGVGAPPVALATHQLDSFMADHYAGVVRTVAVACGDVALAHDAVQDALARALDQQRRGKSIDHLPGWIVVVALNQLRSTFRRRGREARAMSRLPRDEAFGRGAPDDSTLIDLQQAIVRLPMRQRQCIVLHHLQGFGVDEVAALLGVSSGTVKSALFRGRDALRRSLGDADSHAPSAKQEAAP